MNKNFNDSSFLYYDQGWNAFVWGQEFSYSASIEWQDGFNDAKETNAEEIFPSLDFEDNGEFSDDFDEKYLVLGDD